MPVVLKVDRTEPGDGHPSLKVLAKTLSAVQNLALDLGKAHVSLDPTFASRSAVDIERACELVVLGARYGSMVLTIGTTRRAEELWPDRMLPALGAKVEEDVSRFIAAVEDGDERALERILPDPVQRAKATKAFLAGTPEVESGHTLSWGRNSRALHPFRRPDPQIVNRLTAIPMAIAAGVLAAQVMVSGTCLATLDRDGAPAEVQQWISYKVLGQEDTTPYSTDEIQWRGRRFLLANTIACPLSIEDYLVVLQYEPLGIRAYAPTRDEALDDFAEEFAFLWDDYALARDEELSQSAIDLKQRLRDLVKEVVVIEAEEGTDGSGEPQE